MPAKSKSQQRLMGMVHSYNKGEFPDAPQMVKDIAKSMKKKDTEEFASTKHKGLPEHVPEKKDKKKKKKKKKKSKKKSFLIHSLIILANQLDEAGEYFAADLIEKNLAELLEA
jgi:hypothetical protein